MSAPDDRDDTLPPHARETLPEIEPANDAEPPVPVIPAGFAKHAMLAALDDLARVVHLVEATAIAIARQLDAEEPS